MLQTDLPFYNYESSSSGDKPKGKRSKKTYINEHGVECDEPDVNDFKRTFKI